jgi:hypothetical protein
MVWRIRNMTQVIPSYNYLPESWRSDADAVAEKIIEYGATKDLQGMDREMVKSHIKDTLHNLMGDPLINRSVEDTIEDFRSLRNFNPDDPRISDLLEEVFTGTPKERPLTPENVLEAMKTQKVNRSTEPGSFRDMIEIE